MENKLEIQKQLKEDVLELTVSGRIDAYWSEQLDTCLDEEVRTGHHNLLFDLDGVTYISSIGIRLFIKYLKQLNRINGQLNIRTASNEVKSVFSLAGLEGLFSGQPEFKTTAISAESEKFASEKGAYNVTRLQEGSGMSIEMLGNPLKMRDSSFDTGEMATVEFGQNRYGLGIGALGGDASDNRERVGDFLGMSNAVAYLPSDGTHKPDFIVRTANLIPSISVLYGMVMEGQFSRYIRFENQSGSHLYLGDLTEDLVKIGGTGDLALMMLAETSGLVGASLNQSPFSHQRGNSPFDFPGVRDGLNFTTEPAHERMLALVVGVISGEKDSPVRDFTRPIRRGCNIRGHFHAAVFPYVAQKKNMVHPSDAIASLFEVSQPVNILHLMNDEREVNGIGDSEFIQGICWLGSINTRN